MRQQRTRIPGVGADAERVIGELVTQLDDRLRTLERKTGRAGVVSSTTTALPGEFLNIEAPPGGLTVILPAPAPALRNARITLAFRNTNPVRIVAIQGTVNRESFVRNTAIGTFDAICDGLGGWEVETGLSSGGSAVDAEYIVGAAHSSLPSARVATASTEVDVDLTTPNVASWALRTASVVFSKLANLAGLSVLGRAVNSAGAMAAITATAARQTLRANDDGTQLEWGHPVEGRDSGADQGDFYTLDVVDGDGVDLALAVASGVATLTPTIDVSDFAAGGLEDDGSNNLRTSAVTGAISRAAGSTASLFAGIRANGVATTDRTNLNFLNQTYITWSGVDDAANDEIELRANFLGSFYNENSVGSIQTPFISYNDSTMLDAELTDNTGTSGYVDVTFELKPQSAARVIGRARGAGIGIPTALTPDETAAVLRWDSQDDLNVAGLTSDAVIAEDTTSLRFSNGGATGIVRSIVAPTEEGQLVFPEMTTGGGDEFIYVHEDTSQTAANRINCPGGRPFRGNSGGPPHALFYWPRSNRWCVIGPPGGHHASITVVDETFDWVVLKEVPSGTHVLLNAAASNDGCEGASWIGTSTDTSSGDPQIANVSGAAHHIGILRLTTSQGTNDSVTLYQARDFDSPLPTEALWDSDNCQRFQAWVRIPTATSVRVTVGFGQDISTLAGGTEFIGFTADTSGGTSTTNWTLTCRAASTTTEVDSGIAFGTAWHKLEWFRYDEYVIFYINRVFAGIISTNVPNGSGTIGGRVQTRTTVARSLDVDRIILDVLEQALD